MADRKLDEQVIELTEVVEEAPSASPAPGSWMETSPPDPRLAPEKKAPEPPPVSRRESTAAADDLKNIPESPLKKFLLAEEEPTAQFPPPLPAEKPLSSFSPVPPPPRPLTQAGPRLPAEPPKGAFESGWMTPEPPKRSLPNVEAEMRSIREAMLSRVEKWVAQEGVQALERIAREMFPRIAEEALRKEIENMKKEAEEGS